MHDEIIEVATGDEMSMATLSFSNGGMMLENGQVAVATLVPAKALGGAAFGPLKFRVSAKGIAGDWQPLANLVRLPMLKDLQCPATPELACRLSGSNLFLIDSVSDEPSFAHPQKVPEGFLGSAMPVPHPTGGSLYLKLRDDPAAVDVALLSPQEIPTSAGEAERAAARSSSLRGENQPTEAALPQVP
jgi:hypothetical protein